jgi:Uma2 family endonuclease
MIRTPPPGVAPPVYRISVDEYERMVEAGVFDDSRIELVQGLLVRKAVKKPPHVVATRALRQRLERIVPPGWHLSNEDPVRIPPDSEPEPNLALIAGVPEDYTTRHPEPAEVALLAEVAETTLEYDRGDKLLAYASAAIPVYWIVNLVDSQVEVYTQPGLSGYQTRRVYLPGQDIPVVVAGVECGRIAVSDILP